MLALYCTISKLTDEDGLDLQKILSLTAQQSLHRDTESVTMCTFKNLVSLIVLSNILYVYIIMT